MKKRIVFCLVAVVSVLFLISCKPEPEGCKHEHTQVVDDWLSMPFPCPYERCMDCGKLLKVVSGITVEYDESPSYNHTVNFNWNSDSKTLSFRISDDEYKYFFNDDGFVEQEYNGTSGESYMLTYSADGNLLSRDRYVDDVLRSSEKFFDSEFNWIKSSKDFDDSGTVTYDWSYEYTFDANGFYTEKKNYDNLVSKTEPAETDTGTSQINWDGNHSHIVSKVFEHSDFGLNFVDKYIYDEMGRLASYEQYDDDGPELELNNSFGYTYADSMLPAVLYMEESGVQPVRFRFTYLSLE